MLTGLLVAFVIAFLIGFYGSRRVHLEMSPEMTGVLAAVTAAIFILAGGLFFDWSWGSALILEGVLFGVVIFVAPWLGSAARKRLGKNNETAAK